MQMPALFIGHGSPMNGIEDNVFARNWQDLASKIPRPKAILCISAHWETSGTQVTTMPHPRTIHDFGGFPEELYRLQYPAPGSVDLAHTVQSLLDDIPVSLDTRWGLDHGAWIVLRRMYPLADVPVCQLSLDYEKNPKAHYDLAQKLVSLRQKGILILGSGNIVHNLGLVSFSANGFPWAKTFDEKTAELITKGDHTQLVEYPAIKFADFAVPTNEHYLPLLYILGVQQKTDNVIFSAESIIMGSVGMRCVLLNP